MAKLTQAFPCITGDIANIPAGLYSNIVGSGIGCRITFIISNRQRNSKFTGGIIGMVRSFVSAGRFIAKIPFIVVRSKTAGNRDPGDAHDLRPGDNGDLQRRPRRQMRGAGGAIPFLAARIPDCRRRFHIPPHCDCGILAQLGDEIEQRSVDDVEALDGPGA